VQKEKTPCGNKTIMPKVKDITTTQFFKIFTLLKERGEMTGDEIKVIIPNVKFDEEIFRIEPKKKKAKF